MKRNVKIIHFSRIYLKYKGIPKIWCFICAPATDFIKFKYSWIWWILPTLFGNDLEPLGQEEHYEKASRTKLLLPGTDDRQRLNFFKLETVFEGKFNYILHKYSTELLNIRIDIPTNEYRKFITFKLDNMVWIRLTEI